MSHASRRLAGALLVIMPTVVFGGVSLLRLLIDDPAYQANPLRQDLWRAGHAHAGVLLVLALICLRYVDETRLGPRARSVARHGVPLAVSLTAGLLTLGVGLLRNTSVGSAPSQPGQQATDPVAPAPS